MSSASKGTTRRRFLFGSTAAALVGGVGGAVYAWRTSRQPEARVGIYRAATYDAPIADIIGRALVNYPDVVERVRSGTVVLKPNLVEYHHGRSVNTHPAVVAGAIAAFRAAGAKHIIVAEGPGHCRDTELLLEQSGLDYSVSHERAGFVDLNLDAVRPVQLAANYTRMGEISFAETLLGASLIVSMPKLKTHHWAGVTLSMKNLFGTIPGACYGWPKNILHWHGIDNSIVDINLALRPGFAIVDGIEGMEGDGPLQGETVRSGVLIVGDQPAAVDATATRVMGLYPERVVHLRRMVAHGGTVSEARIKQLGESISSVQQHFRVVDTFKPLREPPGSLERLLL